RSAACCMETAFSPSMGLRRRGVCGRISVHGHRAGVGSSSIARQSSVAASFQERTPTAQRTDVFRPFECRSLAQEAAEARPILELHLADTERFRDSGDERAEVSFGNRPYFDVDRLAALGYPDQTGPLGRTAGQGIEAIRVRRARAANEEASTIGQLMVQRQTAHVRAANDQADVSWRTIGFEREIGRA